MNFEVKQAWKSFSNYDLANKSFQADSIKSSEVEWIRVYPSLSESIRVYPSLSEPIRATGTWTLIHIKLFELGCDSQRIDFTLLGLQKRLSEYSPQQGLKCLPPARFEPGTSVGTLGQIEIHCLIILIQNFRKLCIFRSFSTL